MRHIGHRNIKDTQLVKVLTVLGYDIYIPQSYCLPTAIYQKGCPIWVNYNDNGDCDVFETVSKETLYPTLIGIIKRIYPIREGYYCKPLTDVIVRELHFNTTHYYEFSSVCFNEKDEIKAAVCIEEDNELSSLKGFECAKITNVFNKDNNAFFALYNYMFRETNINNYRGLLIMYEPRTQFEIENAKLLSMVKLEDGKYYYQFE